MMAMRGFTGIGLGGAIVAAVALTVEYAPERSRAMLVTLMFVGFPLGGSLGGLLATPLMSAFGWQGVFVFGGLMPLVLIAAVSRYLPESLQFRVAAGTDPAQIGSIVQQIDPSYRYQPGDRFVSGEPRAGSSRIAELFIAARLPGTLLLWLICFANLLVLYLLISWLPSILHEAGLSQARANLGAVTFNLGGVFGGLALSFAVDRLGAFRVLAAGYALTAVVVFAIARTQSMGLAMALAAFAGAGIIGSQFCISALASAFYPTAVRSTGVGWALGVGRMGAILGPLVGGLALASGATMAVIFSAAALPVLLCSAAVMLLSVAYRRAAAQAATVPD
ncbi:MAG: MFS transporter, partial [Steroidobacteraceae bacterium]